MMTAIRGLKPGQDALILERIMALHANKRLSPDGLRSLIMMAADQEGMLAQVERVDAAPNADNDADYLDLGDAVIPA